MPLAEWGKAHNSIFSTLVCDSLEKGRTQQLAYRWEKWKAALYFKGFSLGSSAPLVNLGDLERGRRETWREREEEAFLLVSSSSRMEAHNGLHWANQGPFFLLHYVREFRAGRFPNLQLKHTCGPATLGAPQPCIKLLFNQFTKLGGVFCFCLPPSLLARFNFHLESTAP